MFIEQDTEELSVYAHDFLVHGTIKTEAKERAGQGFCGKKRFSNNGQGKDELVHILETGG